MAPAAQICLSAAGQDFHPEAKKPAHGQMGSLAPEAELLGQQVAHVRFRSCWSSTQAQAHCTQLLTSSRRQAPALTFATGPADSADWTRPITSGSGPMTPDRSCWGTAVAIGGRTVAED